MERTAMNSHLRFAAHSLFATLLLGTVASAADAPAPSLQEKLNGVLGRPGGLTADRVAARAESTSFEIIAKSEELNAAAAGVDQALVGYFPRLTLTGRYTRLSPIDTPNLGTIVGSTTGGPITIDNTDPANPKLQPGLAAIPLKFDVPLNQILLQANLALPISDYLLRIPQAYASATKNQKAAALTEKATRLKTASDAKVTYYTWVRAKLQEVVAEQALDQAKAHLVDVQHAFTAGTVSKADVLRIESQVASSQLLYERAKSFASVTETQIRVAMHDSSASRYEVGETVEAELAPMTQLGTTESMWTEARNNRLEVRALDESAGALREQAKVARAGNLPRLDAFGDVISANPNQRIFPAQPRFDTTWDVGVQLTWSPNDVGTSSSSGKALDARAASLLAQKQALEDGIRVEVTQTNNSLHEAEVAIESSARGLAAAEESYRVRRSLFQNGRATSVELTDAETDLTRSRLEAINARVDLRIAHVRLEHALGRDVGRVAAAESVTR
jgi:outer membrane protein TolC